MIDQGVTKLAERHAGVVDVVDGNGEDRDRPFNDDGAGPALHGAIGEVVAVVVGGEHGYKRVARLDAAPIAGATGRRHALGAGAAGAGKQLIESNADSLIARHRDRPPCLATRDCASHDAGEDAIQSTCRSARIHSRGIRTPARDPSWAAASSPWAGLGGESERS